jgi:hypothetical protein
VQRPRHLGAVRVACGWLLGEGAHHDATQLGRNSVWQGGRRILEVADAELHRRARVERRTPGEHLVEDHAGAVDVGRRCIGAAARLLGGHVARRAEDLGGHRARGALGEPRHTEVADLDRAVGGEHHVRGLDVAVHDPLRVCAAERAAELLGDSRRLRGRERAAGETVLEALAVDQLGDVVGTLLGVPEVEDLHDAGVVDAGQQLGLRLEAAHPLAVLRPPRLDHLDGDRPGQASVGAGVHAPEGALADQRVQLVAVLERTADQVRGS